MKKVLVYDDNLSLLATLGAGLGFAGLPGAIRSPMSKPPKAITDADRQRIAEAEERRARRARKRMRDAGFA